MSSSRRALALLVVVAVLGILGALGASFLGMAQLERRASQQRLHATQALLLARSGLEDALARMSAGQDASAPQSAYGGENWDGSADGLLSGWEAQQEVYRATGTGTPADIETCPVAQALRPSFFVAAGANPATVAVDGRQRGYSGVLAANAYSLKVEDESAKINVNGGFLDAQDRDKDGLPDFRDPFVADLTPGLPAEANGIGRGFNGQLARILGILLRQGELGLPVLPTAGTDILLRRPSGGYRSVAQVQAALGTAKDLSPWLTVSSWVDAKVVHPNGYASQAPAKAMSEVKMARLPLALEEGGRPPVNLNAASRPVLVALLQDLSGRTWYDPGWGDDYRIPAAMAAGAADAFLGTNAALTGTSALAARRPFATWEQFSGACDVLVPGVINATGKDPMFRINPCCADLLKANFDPNTRLAKELPDQLVWRWIDKSDLTVWSTEGNLGPTGVFKVGVVGRVLAPGGRLLAEKALSVTVEAYSLLRQTSQRDFVAARPLPTEYLSLANPSPFPALPQRTTGASAAWNPLGGGQGLGAVTYPCAPGALPARAADFDGCLGLGTVEMGPGDPPSGRVMFLQHFDDGWDAEPVPGNPGNHPLLQPGQDPFPVQSVFQADATRSVWPASGEPGALYPDGAHAQYRRGPAYQAFGNFPLSYTSADAAQSNHGVIGYWVKPMVAGGYNIQVTCKRGQFPDTQILGIGPPCNLLRGLEIMLEDRIAPYDPEPVGSSRHFRTHEQWGQSEPLPGLRWQLVTACFDTDETLAGQDVRVALESAARPPGMGVDNPCPYTYTQPFATAQGQDLFAPGVVFVLGTSMLTEPTCGNFYSSNQVIDEFAICDFGDTAVSALDAGALWAAARYHDGRYYKGGDGSFLSAPLRPAWPGPARLLRADWTGYLPAASRTEIALDFIAPGGEDWGTFPDAGKPRLADPVLADDPATGRPRAWIEVDLMDGGGTLTGPALLPSLVRGERIGRSLASFRYRVRFRTDLADPVNDPVLETPVLDDITFAWQGASGPRILGWWTP